VDSLLLEIVRKKFDIFIKSMLLYSSWEDFVICVIEKRKFSNWRTMQRCFGVFWGLCFCGFLTTLVHVYKNVPTNHLTLHLASDLGCRCLQKESEIY